MMADRKKQCRLIDDLMNGEELAPTGACIRSCSVGEGPGRTRHQISTRRARVAVLWIIADCVKLSVQVIAVWKSNPLHGARSRKLLNKRTALCLIRIVGVRGGLQSLPCNRSKRVRGIFTHKCIELRLGSSEIVEGHGRGGRNIVHVG